MDPASKLRSWARRCREQAEHTDHDPTAEALRELASDNEAAAKVFERGEPPRAERNDEGRG